MVQLLKHMGQIGTCFPVHNSESLMDSTNSNTSGGSPSNMQDFLSSSAESLHSVDPDVLVAKLKMVVDENLELKETIAQNNLAMQQQLNLVVKWGQQYRYQNQQHCHLVNDLQCKLSSYEKENASLRLQKHPSKDGTGSSSDEVLQLFKQKLDETEKLLRQARDGKEDLLNANTRLEGDISLYKCHMTTMRGELERVQLERDDLQTRASELNRQLKLRKETSIIDISEHTQITSLKNELMKEREASVTLLQEIKTCRARVESLQKENEKSKEEASLYRSCYNEILSSQATKENSRKTQLDDLEKRRLKDEVAMYKEEIDTLDKALTEERSKAADDRRELARAHTELCRLKRELQEAREEFDHSLHDDKHYEAKLKKLSEQYDEATAKLVSYEELLAAKNEELSRLKRELGQAKAQLTEVSSEGETIAVLRAQVEVYQGDFRAEREAREVLAADREKLRDELRHLHTRYMQLVDELGTYQRKQHSQGLESRAGSEEPQSSRRSPVASESLWERSSLSPDKRDTSVAEDRSPKIDEDLFYCPKCNKAFSKIQPLEEHVNRCLDED